MFLVNNLILVQSRANTSNSNQGFKMLRPSVLLLKMIVLIFIISSCQDELPSKPEPDNLLSEDKMVEILTELSELESEAQLKYVQTTKYAKLLTDSGDSLLKAKGVSSKDFELNMDYYGSRQEEIIAIYQKVKTNLLKEKEVLEKQLLEERKTEVDRD